MNRICNKVEMERRKFIETFSLATGAAILLSSPLAVLAEGMPEKKTNWKVEDIIRLFLKQIPSAPFTNTVDTLKSGTMDTVVTGVVTTMFATIAVIEKAIHNGANFIIAHEPTFYNHLDETEWLKNDDVYKYKAALLEKHKITVWRNHDYIHSLSPDGVRIGVLEQLGWIKYYDPQNPQIVLIPPMPVHQLIQNLKEKLDINKVRYIGDLQQRGQKILLMPGASGGRRQIESISKAKPDIVICGEIQEWETAEYIRDAIAEGQKITLIVLGHIASEEPGSAFMAKWIKENIPGMVVKHIPASNSLSYY